MLQLFLQRNVLTPSYTAGTIYDRNKREKICDTLEDPVRSFRFVDPITRQAEADREFKPIPYWKIPTFTAIEAGIYPLTLRKSPSFGMNMVMLVNVPFFEYIYIHFGAGTKNTNGCICVGTFILPECLRDRDMRQKITTMFLKNNCKGEIEIQNPQRLAL